MERGVFVKHKRSVPTVEPSKRVEGAVRVMIKRPKVCYP